MNIYFIRHAESLKSTEDRHGGFGLPLTDQGKFDTIELISFLETNENLDFKRSLFFCSNLIQVRETAKIIEERKNVSFQITEAVKNISLGILSGFSKEEAFKKFPVEANNLEKWRRGKIKIDEFSIPNAETLVQFYNRIFNFIYSLVHQKNDAVIIGTRSVGVAITNIFKNFSNMIDLDNYNRFLFDPSSISKYYYESHNPQIIYINKTDFLTTKAKYPDQ